MDISNERKKALKQAYKEKAAEEELHRRIRNLDDFRRLWKELVPATGPADFLQGELLRAVENLRDESCRNGNRNFGLRHLEQCRLLRDTLNNWPDFTSDARNTYARQNPDALLISSDILLILLTKTPPEQAFLENIRELTGLPLCVGL